MCTHTPAADTTMAAVGGHRAPSDIVDERFATPRGSGRFTKPTWDAAPAHQLQQQLAGHKPERAASRHHQHHARHSSSGSGSSSSLNASRSSRGSSGDYGYDETAAGRRHSSLSGSSSGDPRFSTPRSASRRGSSGGGGADGVGGPVARNGGGRRESAVGALNEHSGRVVDIFSCARHNRVEEVEQLLDRGVPVDTQDSHGNTVLTIACQNGHKRLAKAALRRGCNINLPNYIGNTPLHFCYAYGYGDTLGQYLITKGADDTQLNHAGFVCYCGMGR